MLIQFVVENFRSFRGKAVLSMRAGTADPESPLFAAAGDELVSRAAVLYGANASGKSNLVRAIEFARHLITEGTPVRKAIPHSPFRLDPNCRARPSRFEFTFVRAGTQYSYGFLVDGRRVHAEWLFRGPEDSEEILFEREFDDASESYQFALGERFITEPRRRQFYEFLHESTRANQLFLRAAEEREAGELEPPLAWFRDSLNVITPDADYMSLPLVVDADAEFRKRLGRLLKDADIGIRSIRVERSRHSFPDVPEGNPKDMDLWQKLQRLHDAGAMVMDGNVAERLVKNSQGDIEIERLRLVTNHHGIAEHADFEVAEESDGTRRLMHLAPVLYSTAKDRDTVFVIDELERSLHPLLTQRFLRQFLGDADSSHQLICTTHEDNLLDVELLAPEAIWFVEKDEQGGSHLYSLDEFDAKQLEALRDHKRQGYLAGRFGAIPFLGDARRLLPRTSSDPAPGDEQVGSDED